MKYIICFIFFFSFGVSLNAQHNNKAQAVTKKWTQRYQLDDSQRSQLLNIQKRKFKNLDEIRSLQKSNPGLYLKKKSYVFENSLSNFKKILRADQLGIYESDWKKWQKKRSEKIAELKEAGAQSETIKLAILEVEF